MSNMLYAVSTAQWVEFDYLYEAGKYVNKTKLVLRNLKFVFLLMTCSYYCTIVAM